MNTINQLRRCPNQLAFPTTFAEIQSILRDRSRYPSPVRAKGSYHSLTPCASTEGTIIDMTRMKRILQIDTESMTLTAEAGLQLVHASKALRVKGMQFITNVEIGNITLGSAACCHSKDARHAAFDALELWFGGVIYEVTLRIKPLEAIHF